MQKFIQYISSFVDISFNVPLIYCEFLPFQFYYSYI